MHIFIPNMKFLCLTLWLGELCTDDNDSDSEAWQQRCWAMDDGKSKIVKDTSVDKPNEPKRSKVKGKVFVYYGLY